MIQFVPADQFDCHAGIGNGERRHLVLNSQLAEQLDRQRAFGQRVGRMRTQVNEAGAG